MRVNRILGPCFLFLLISCSPGEKTEVVIDTVTPSSVSARGGETVTITGKGFSEVAGIRVGGVLCDATKVGVERITLVSPSLVAGLQPIELLGEDGLPVSSADLTVRPTLITFTAVGAPYLPRVPGGEFTALVPGDYDGDGNIDVFVPERDTPLFLRGRGDGLIELDASPLMQLIPGPMQAIGTDLTQDGRADLLLCRDDGLFSSVWVGDGETALSPVEVPRRHRGCLAPSILRGVDTTTLAFFAHHPFEEGVWRLTLETLGTSSAGAPSFEPVEALLTTADVLGNMSVYTSDSTIVTQCVLEDIDAPEGRGIARIDYDFTRINGYSFVSFANGGGFDRPPETLRLDIEGDGRGLELTLRVWDANDERYAISMGVVDWTGWRTLEATGIPTWGSYSGDADGIFQTPVNKISVQLGNGDGTPTAQLEGSLRVDNILLSDASGVEGYLEDFERQVGRFTLSARPVKTAAADLDGDGTGELMVLTEAPSSPLRILSFHDTLDGTVVFVNERIVPLGNGVFRDFCLVDLEGDGDLDVFIVNGSGQDQFLVNDGSGHFAEDSARVLPFDQGAGAACAVADLDMDGFDDLIIAGPDALPRFYRNTGAGAFEDYTPNLDAISARWSAFAVADFDGDGDPDILAYLPGEGFSLYIQDNEPPEEM